MYCQKLDPEKSSWKAVVAGAEHAEMLLASFKGTGSNASVCRQSKSNEAKVQQSMATHRQTRGRPSRFVPKGRDQTIRTSFVAVAPDKNGYKGFNAPKGSKPSSSSQSDGRPWERRLSPQKRNELLAVEPPHTACLMSHRVAPGGSR
jgi:hypothetical protein